MKKSIFILALLLAAAFGAKAQVTIERTEKKFEYPLPLNYRFVHNLSDDSYFLNFTSDNEFEKTTLWIQLGKMDDAILSLEAILEMLENEGDYKLSGHDCLVTRNGVLCFYNTGELEHAVGNYMTNRADIKKFLRWLKNHKEETAEEDE